jgi:hypothetical protein
MDGFAVLFMIVGLGLVQAANSTILLVKKDLPSLGSQALGCALHLLVLVGLLLSLASIVVAFIHLAWYFALGSILAASLIWTPLYKRAQMLALPLDVTSLDGISRSARDQQFAENWERYSSLPRRAFMQLVVGIGLLVLWNDATWAHFFNLI